MADAINIKEVPEPSKRLFNRIDSVKEVPNILYDAEEVPIEDRAVFEISPADPVTRDELKQIVLGKTVLQVDIAEANGISQSDFATTPELVLEEAPEKETKKKREEREHRNKVAELVHLGLCERIAVSLQQIQQCTEAMMSTEEARRELSKCVKVSNYKELNNGVLEVSTKSNLDILLNMPDIFVVWCFTRVQEMSNLTDAEVLGF